MSDNTQNRIQSIEVQGETHTGLIKFGLTRYGKTSPRFVASRAQLLSLAAILNDVANEKWPRTGFRKISEERK